MVDYANEAGAGSSGLGQEENVITLEMFCPVFVLTVRKIKRIRRVAALRSHGVVIHQCESCDYETESKQRLVQHVRTHTGEK